MVMALITSTINLVNCVKRYISIVSNPPLSPERSSSLNVQLITGLGILLILIVVIVVPIYFLKKNKQTRSITPMLDRPE